MRTPFHAKGGEAVPGRRGVLTTPNPPPNEGAEAASGSSSRRAVVPQAPRSQHPTVPRPQRQPPGAAPPRPSRYPAALPGRCAPPGPRNPRAAPIDTARSAPRRHPPRNALSPPCNVVLRTPIVEGLKVAIVRHRSLFGCGLFVVLWVRARDLHSRRGRPESRGGRFRFSVFRFDVVVFLFCARSYVCQFFVGMFYMYFN